MNKTSVNNRLTQPASQPAEALEQDLSCFFEGALAKVRWVVLVAVLLLAIAQPLQGRAGLPTWALILIFVGYNLLLELLRHWIPRLRSFARVPLFDLPVVAIIYALGATPGGPLFVLLLLIVTCAAASMSIQNALIYTALVMILIALIAPTLPTWLGNVYDMRELGVQLIVVGLVGSGAALLVRQLTHERLATQASRDETERLTELDRLRTQFIATISHDLRTPLTAAKAGLGMLELSVTERLQPKEQQLMHNVHRNIERLEQHISDLLALNQLEAGVMRLDVERLDLRMVVTEAMSAVHTLMEGKGQQLELDLPEPLVVSGDPKRLEQVIVNLLCNAYEHTPRGTRVTVRGNANNDEVCIVIADNGPGIPPDEHATIFAPFQRLSSSAGGSGLGLAIVKGIVELHDGRIQVDPSRPQGTAFQITLPCHGLARGTAGIS